MDISIVVAILIGYETSFHYSQLALRLGLWSA